jgi:hypothetical protein
MAGKGLHYQAGFAIGVGMQYECRLGVLLLVSTHQPRGIFIAQLLIAECFQGAGVVSPAAFHFDPDLQIYFAAESFFHILACRLPISLSFRPGALNLVARLVDNDRSMNFAQLAFVLNWSMVAVE